MANGKGTLDCAYCKHFGGNNKHVPGWCAFHRLQLPNVQLFNKVCINFEPTEDYWRHNGPDTPPARRFSWLAESLEPQVLYVFSYNSPNLIKDRIKLLPICDASDGPA